MKNLLLLFLMFFITSYSYGQLYGPTDDFDGDGYSNDIDIDDDNDGIPDIVESFCEAYVTDYVTGSDVNIDDPNYIVGEPDANSTEFSFSDSEIIIDFGQELTSGTTIYFEAYKSGTADKTLYIQSSNSDGTTLGATGDILITNNNYNSVPDYEFTLTENSRYFRLYRNDGYVTNIYIDAIIHQEGRNCALSELTDEDRDGIPDKFDLDSDNDGCPDSLEGDGTQILLSQIYINATNSDPYQNGMIKTPIGNNGLAIIVGSGNGLGSSESPFEQSDECQYWCSDPNGPDTDGDGRGDKCDADDDNDGILDVDEGLECTMFATFFNGQRTYTGGGNINDAEVNGVMILEDFIREIDDLGNEVANGQTYDLRVELTDIYQPAGATYDQRVDFQWSSSTSSDELVVLYGGPPTDNPHIKMSMTLLENGNAIGLSDATIRFADIDSNENTNFTDVVGVLNNDGQLTSSSPILRSDLSDIQFGGFEYGTLSPQVQAVNSNYDLYRLKQDTGNTNGPWYAAGNETIPNPTFNVTAGFKFDQLNTLNVVWGYTTDDPSPSTTTNLNRGLAFSRDDFVLCVYTDTDQDGIPNEEDLDSDGDGCPDAIEGGGTYDMSDIIIANNIPGGNNYDGSSTATYNGIVNTPSYETLDYGSGTSNSYGIPLKVDTDNSDDLSQSQSIGSSQDININGCSCEKEKVFDDQNIVPSLVGVTSISRDMTTSNEVITSYSDGFIALESKTLGFVPTRIPSPENVFDGNSSTPSTEDDAVEGMVVWDSDRNCLRLYDGNVWRCLKKSCDDPVVPTSRNNNQ